MSSAWELPKQSECDGRKRKKEIERQLKLVEKAKVTIPRNRKQADSYSVDRAREGIYTETIGPFKMGREIARLDPDEDGGAPNLGR
jgi:hypothetical protein